MTIYQENLIINNAPSTGLEEAYELRIGAVGHRNMAQPAAMDAAVRRLLKRMSQILTKDHATPLHWIVVSPLAKGADRIITRVALEVVQARLDVITPFSLEEYRRDFADQKDAAEFEDLFGRRNNLTILSQPDSKSSELPTIKDGHESLTKEQRHRGYLHVGQAVVERG